MNSLQEILLKGGDPEGRMKRRQNSSFFRQYLPASAITKYNLVVSSRSLLELDSMEMRIRTLDILWKTVTPGGYLVLIEAGNVHGTQLLLEARRYLLEEVDASSLGTQPQVVAPCPHQMRCPLMEKEPKYRICSNSVIHYHYKSTNATPEPFSYIIFYKPEKISFNPSVKTSSWPRIVQPVLKPSSGFNIIRVCQKYGNLQELSVTKGKHGTFCSRVAKCSKIGDLFPVEVVDTNEDYSNPDQDVVNSEQRNDFKDE